jgi:hypothetical protein
MDISAVMDDNSLIIVDSRLQGRTTETISGPKVMIKKAATMASPPPVEETEAQRFGRILSRDQFKPLKAVFDNLGSTIVTMQGALVTTGSYRNFLDKLGYRLVLVKQIHEQDCYSRLGPAGGIRAVLPVHDIATYSTMVTLVNFDSTVSTTPNSAEFYDEQLAQFKVLLMNRSGNAV